MDDPVLGGDVGALDDGQQIPLDALAGDIRVAAAPGLVAGGDLVDLVEKDDPGLLDPLEGSASTWE